MDNSHKLLSNTALNYHILCVKTSNSQIFGHYKTTTAARHRTIYLYVCNTIYLHFTAQ